MMSQTKFKIKSHKSNSLLRKRNGSCKDLDHDISGFDNLNKFAYSDSSCDFTDRCFICTENNSTGPISKDVHKSTPNKSATNFKKSKPSGLNTPRKHHGSLLKSVLNLKVQCDKIIKLYKSTSVNNIKSNLYRSSILSRMIKEFYFIATTLSSEADIINPLKDTRDNIANNLSKMSSCRKHLVNLFRCQSTDLKTKKVISSNGDKYDEYVFWKKREAKSCIVQQLSTKNCLRIFKIKWETFQQFTPINDFYETAEISFVENDFHDVDINSTNVIKSEVCNVNLKSLDSKSTVINAKIGKEEPEIETRLKEEKCRFGYNKKRNMADKLLRYKLKSKVNFIKKFKSFDDVTMGSFIKSIEELMKALPNSGVENIRF